jgi:hypothetical protein
LDCYPTVFQAEVFAILKATEELQGLMPRGDSGRVVIMSDSQAALQALQATHIQSKLVWQTIGALNELALRFGTELRWIKAHVGHEGNERADQAAKRGSLGMIDVFAASVEMPVKIARNKIVQELEKRWNAELKGRKEARQTKIFFPQVDARKSRDVYKLSRPACGKMIRYITGHAYLRRHQTIVYGSGDERCRFCREDPEEPQHLILSCPRLSRVRGECFLFPGGVIPQEEASNLKICRIWSFLQKMGELEDEDAHDY